MNDLTQNRDSRKSIIATVASVLACFALVMSLLPAAAIADDVQDPETPGTEQPGGDQGTTEGDGSDNEGDGNGDQGTDELKEVGIPAVPTSLVYNGAEQLLLAKNDGYTIEFDKDSGAIDTDTAVVALNAGEYTLTLELNEGYKWVGGGTDAVERTVTIAPYDLSATGNATVTAPDITYSGKAAEPAVTITLKNDIKPVADTDYTVEYTDNDAVGTAYVTVEGKGNFTGKKIASFAIGEGQNLYRLYNPYSGEHLYTYDQNEQKELVKLGWNDEGIAWYAPKKSDVPVFRLYNPYSGDHHYTTSSNERDGLVKIGWKDEGIGWYSEEAQTVEVLRIFNPFATTSTHLYTLDSNEVKVNVDRGWKDEGVGWYAAEMPASTK